jgi:site-specific DNA recombinase
MVSSLNRKCIIYTRVSSKEQEKEGFSIAAQQKLLQIYASENQLNIVREFQDVETAKQAGRTGFADMLNFFNANKDIKVLLVEKTDRLYRNLKDWVTIDEFDLEIHLVKENVILSESSRSSEKFMHGIRVLMAKNYIDNLSEETRKGMTEKAEQGIWPSYAPLGYTNIASENGKKIIKPDGDIAPLITKLFEWYSTGRYSILELTKMIKETGLRYRSKNTISKGAVHKILRNRIYMGEFEWDGKVYQGNHEPLVNSELWTQCQNLLTGRYLSTGKRKKRNFAFSGLVSCGHCHCSLVGEIKKGKYIYYHCSGHKGKCQEPYVREEVLADHFSQVIKRLEFPRNVLEWVKEALLSSNKETQEYHEKAIAKLQAEYKKLETRIQQMYVDKLDGKILGDFFDSMATKWRAEQTEILTMLQKHQNANKNYIGEGVKLLELAQNSYKLFVQQDPAEKRRLLNFLVSNSYWADKNLKVVLRKPFDLLTKISDLVDQDDYPKYDKLRNFDIWLPDADSNHGPSD